MRSARTASLKARRRAARKSRAASRLESSTASNPGGALGAAGRNGKSAPTILKSATGADFLATLPTLAGYTSRNSLLVVPMQSNRTLGVIRFDLPDPARTDRPDRLAAVVTSMLSRVDRCDHVVLAMYADGSFLDVDAACIGLWTRLERAIEAAGFGIRDSFRIADDGWGSWYDPALPAGGRPLAEIEDSPLAAKAASVRNGQELREFDADAILPTPDGRLARRTADALDVLAHGYERTPFGGFVPVELPDPVTFVEGILRSDPDGVSPAKIATMALLCDTPSSRDVISLQIAFGEEIGREVAEAHAQLHLLQAESGLPMDDVVRRQLEAGIHPLPRSGGMFLGQTEETPDRERIRQGIALLRRVIAHLPLMDRPGALCVLAWLHWAVGESSVAGIHLDSAARIDPTLRMITLLQTLVGSGALPDWVYRRRGG